MKIVSLKITEIFKSLMKNNILQLHNQSERTVEKIDCPFSMPMSRKERPPMTKPREKTREELQAEIEGEKKKIRQFENREKMLRQKLFKEERRTRRQRLNETFPYFPCDYLIRAKIRENTYYFTNEWAEKPVK